MARLREQANNGQLLVRDLSQAHVLSSVLSLSEEDALKVPLEQLGALAVSKVFLFIWKEAGAQARRTLESLREDDERGGRMGHDGSILPSAASDGFGNGNYAVEEYFELEASRLADIDVELESDEDRSQVSDEEISRLNAASHVHDVEAGSLSQDDDIVNRTSQGFDNVLPLSTLVSNIIPEALSRWKDLYGQVSSMEISSSTAQSFFGQQFSAHRVEEQIRLMLLLGADPAVAVPAPVKAAVSLSSGDALLEALRMTIEKYGDGSMERLARNVLYALRAHDCIKWGQKNIRKLLHAQLVFHSPSVGLTDGGSRRSPLHDPAPENSTTSADISPDDVGDDLDGGSGSEVDRDEEPVPVNSISCSGDNCEESSVECETVVQIFAVSPDSDASRGQLEEILRKLLNTQLDMSLSQALHVWKMVGEWGKRSDSRYQPHDTNLIERARVHVELVIKLASCPPLVQWLTEVCIYIGALASWSTVAAVL